MCEGTHALCSGVEGGLVGHGHRTHAEARSFLDDCSENSLVFFLA